MFFVKYATGQQHFSFLKFNLFYVQLVWRGYSPCVCSIDPNVVFQGCELYFKEDGNMILKRPLL